jgi:hypothetical protein
MKTNKEIISEHMRKIASDGQQSLRERMGEEEYRKMKSKAGSTKKKLSPDELD